jgi:hypothetical protein
MPKKTDLITYNLAERGRKHSGVDRSDMDIQSAINHINSASVQELVNSGDLFGYYGHETRARFGMSPPDSWVNSAGETVPIVPAIRTIKLSANSNGDVTHKAEFLNTNEGKYSEGLYASKVGGFSSAIMRKRGSNGLYGVTGFYGFDYVRSPNYNTNRGESLFDALFVEEEDGEFAFDSVAGMTPQQSMIKSALETAIMHQYDSITTAIASDAMINHYQNEVVAAQEEAINREVRLNNIRASRVSRKEAIFDSLICPSVPFSEITAQWDSFNDQGTSDKDLRTTESAKKTHLDSERKTERVFLFGKR